MILEQSTTESTMVLGTTVSALSHTVKQYRPKMNSQSTAKRRVVMGTTVTPITVYSKLLEVQYGCRVGC